MTNFTYEIDIPFTENPGRQCAIACTDMLLKHLLPEQQFTLNDARQLSGYHEGRSTWAAQHLLSLSDLGIEVGWIQDEDLAAFSADPKGFILKQVGSEDALRDFQKTNDIQLESKRIKDYLDRGLPFEQRPATQEDITSTLLGGYAVRLEVNGKVLAGKDGFEPHTVLVSAFNEEVIRLENPDGKFGSKPKQIVSWETLHTAWDEPTMQCYRRPE